MLRPAFPFVVLLAACAGTTSTPTGDAVAPGVVIHAASLVAPYGCGTKPGQVYKYVAAIISPAEASVPILRSSLAGQPLPSFVHVAGVFDCFADGLLANLPPADLPDNTSDYRYALAIYAYDKPTYDAAQATVAATVAPPFDVSPITQVPYSYRASCSAQLPTSGLTAGNFPLIQVVAVCQPLAPAQYSDSFTSGARVTTACTHWKTYVASLQDGYARMKISGTNDSVGITCDDAAVVNNMADALRNHAAYTAACNGHTWSNCNRSGDELWIDPPSPCSVDNCPNPGYVLRPCIGNTNWGGVNTATCDGEPTQTMTLSFQ